ncbi:hypothetical protein [Paenibacillus riograndensis]|uniref:Putative membrane protein n=1 Tax=Paenibacillus riograndensis SBR5 TaxID=1073571 RepID=A0A0E4HCN0_9BACL|nr:hypothetical protein [Paenibacillus riograndensis]CQR56546.1 putative membrane protein [Paenibacillus riograndensis SBR5]
MTTKKRNFVIAAIAIPIISIVGFLFMFTNIINPNTIFVSQCNITNNSILIKDAFTDSANKYRGYKLTYNDNTLYIKIKGSLLSFNGSAGDFNISINNDFGNIQKIYLQGSNSSQRTLIWSKQK